MSSTNRSDARKNHKFDYYVTPIAEIETFINFIHKIVPNIFTGKILDSCAGGDNAHAMSYPTVINKIFPQLQVDTVDIRDDSLAEIKMDYLNFDCTNRYNTIITNPPFNNSLEIIKKAIEDVRKFGFVIMLQRLNFMGSKSRKAFWEENMPKYIVVHHKRMSFTDNGGTDSIEYAHYIWQKGVKVTSSQLYII